MKFPHTRKLLAVGTAGAVALALTAAGPADAAQATGKTFTFTLNAPNSAHPDTINCNLNPESPFEYYGGTYGGGEDGVGTATCTGGTVYEIQITAALFYQNLSNEVSYSTNTELETTEATASTVYPLEAGDYYTAVQATITATYGGTPVTSSIYVSSPIYLP